MILSVVLNFSKIVIVTGLGMIISFFADINNPVKYYLMLIFGFLYLIIGLIFEKFRKRKQESVNNKKTILSLVILWPFVGILTTIPLGLSSYFTFTEAWFESISAFTTTGATMLSAERLFVLPNSIILWRSILQSIGGMGMIIMIVILLYKSREEVYLIFKSSGFYSHYNLIQSDVTMFLRKIVIIYLLLNVICTILYCLFGMSFFNAICTAMSTISTGGMLGNMNVFIHASKAIKIVTIAFMLIGAIPFVMIYSSIISRKFVFIYEDIQVRILFLIILISSIMYSELNFHTNDIFNIVSSITTTGFVVGDIKYSWQLWYLLILGCIGSCAGSTSGGIKIFRIIICYKYVDNFIKKIVSPKSINVMKIMDNKITENDIQYSITVFILFFLTLIVGSIVFAMIFGKIGISIDTVLSFITNSGIDSKFITILDGLSEFKKAAFAIISSIIMIIGRVDFVLFFVVISNCFRKR